MTKKLWKVLKGLEMVNDKFCEKLTCAFLQTLLQFVKNTGAFANETSCVDS